MSQATSHTPFDFTVDTSPKTGGKCTNSPLQGEDPFHKKQVKKEGSKRKVLALYEDYLKKRVKEVWPNLRMGNRLFEEIKAKGYRGSLSTVKKFLRRLRVEGEFPKEKFLSYYKDYLKKRLEQAQPNCVSTRKLFNEITAKGYRESFSVLDKFLWVIRKKTKAPKEASIQFYKKYLIKRVKEAYPEYVSVTALFEEISAQGYRGSASMLQGFLSMLRKQEKKPSEMSLDFHKDYLIKRVKEAYPKRVSGMQLLEEIRAKGYRGSITTLQGFLAAFHKQEKTPSEDLSNASLEFHRDYLTKRLEETYPSHVSGTQLFKEIRAKGYRGSSTVFRVFLSTLRKQEKRPNKACVKFHKDYLTKRLEETYPSYVSGTQLFKEIRAKGYRGSMSTLQGLLSALRKQGKKPREACVEFHKDYLTKRLEETYPSYVSGTQLFKEIRAKGYRGSITTFRMFFATLCKQEKKPNEACVEFHKEYLSKRLEEASYVSGTQLFKEIRAKGYRGSLTTFRLFFATLRKQEKRPNKACVEFYEEYLSKRLRDTYPSYASGIQLFKEIRAKGYHGSFSTLQAFLSPLRKQEKRPSEACV